MGTSAALLSGRLHFEPVSDADVTGTLDFRKGGTSRGCKANGAHFTPARSPLPPGRYALNLTGAGVSESSTVTLSSNNTAVAAKPVVASAYSRTAVKRGGVRIGR